ncbi:uncharacterized protein LOC117316195 isoform X2 [Pecten maximus]|uniref:uncharacterized protein LOC117316195 isoform X2 n=1 Tax=Pecten maximus TaxID=6579 RepID=UPI001458DE00|nr:uncharacterized protein LOC117316195 isoform X2 [Pecten maximus]
MAELACIQMGPARKRPASKGPQQKPKRRSKNYSEVHTPGTNNNEGPSPGTGASVLPTSGTNSDVHPTPGGSASERPTPGTSTQEHHTPLETSTTPVPGTSNCVSPALNIDELTATITSKVLSAVLAGLQAQGLPVGTNRQHELRQGPTAVGPVTRPSAAMGAPHQEPARIQDSVVPGPSGNISFGQSLPVAGTNLSQASPICQEKANGIAAGIPASQLLPHLERLLTASLAPSSKSTYKKAWTVFANFASQYGFRPFTEGISPLHMALFVAYLHKQDSSPKTISTYLSAVTYVYKLLYNMDPADSFLVKKLVSGAYRLTPTVDMRLPITVPILNRLVAALDQLSENQFEMALFKAMFLFAFNALTRVGEIAGPLGSVNLVTFENVSFVESQGTTRVQVRFYNFKHNADHSCHTVVFGHGPTTTSAVGALSAYLQFRSVRNGPLFCLLNGQSISRSYFDSKLHACLAFCQLSSSFYKGHSFRIGAATFAAENGLSDAHIRSLGRWKSNAFRKYIRITSP